MSKSRTYDDINNRVSARLRAMSAEIDRKQQDISLTSMPASFERSALREDMMEEQRYSMEAPMESFHECLERHFDEKTVTQVLSAIEKLQLPLPASDIEFLGGTEGVLLFSNRFGMTLRIEKRDENVELLEVALSRVNDNPWILQTIGSVTAGNAVIEICPGVHTTDNLYDAHVLESALAETGAEFYDVATSNAGRLPLRTRQHPNGIPVVIDRLAVRKLSEAPTDIARALARMGVTDCPQGILYKDLREAFATAWPEGAETPDPAAMKNFWHQMQLHRGQGVLVAGWNEKIRDEYKITTARVAAAAYDQRLGQAFKKAKRTGKEKTRRPASPKF